MSRYVATTEHLRDVARDILLRVGARSFTQDALAREGYAAVGSIYERWPTKWHTLVDLADFRVIPAFEQRACDATTGLPWSGLRDLLDTPDGRRDLQLVAEIMMGSRDDGRLSPYATRLHDLVAEIASATGDNGDEGLTWWLTILTIGWAMLLTGDMAPPPVADSLQAISRREFEPRSAEPLRIDAPAAIPPTEIPPPTDEKGQLLKTHTRDLLTASDGAEVNTRRISSLANVSTGAMYRRFPSRGDLLRSILIDEFQSDRYEWSVAMIAAMTGNDPTNEVVDVSTRGISRLYDDRKEQALILEITAAARAEERLRTQLVSQIMTSIESRTALFTRLREAGFISQAITGEEFAWLFQAQPIGARLLGALDIRPSEAVMRQGFKRATEGILTDVVTTDSTSPETRAG